MLCSEVHSGVLVIDNNNNIINNSSSCCSSDSAVVAWQYIVKTLKKVYRKIVSLTTARIAIKYLDIWIGDCLRTGKLSVYTTNTKVNSAILWSTQIMQLPVWLGLVIIIIIIMIHFLQHHNVLKYRGAAKGAFTCVVCVIPYGSVPLKWV